MARKNLKNPELQKDGKQSVSDETMYRGLFENSAAALFITKPDGSILEANQAAMDMFGYTVDEFRKIGRQGIIAPDSPGIADRLKERLESGRTKGELIGIRKNGDRFWCEFSSTITAGPSGEKVGSVMMLDITDRKLTEERLISVTNNVPGVVFRYTQKSDGTDSLENVSEGSREIWGLSPEEAVQDIGKVWQRFHKDDVESVQKSIEQSARDRSQWNSEYRFHHPDGSLRWYRGSGKLVTHNKNRIVWDSLIIDITEQKTTENALRKVMDQSLDVICTINGEGNFVRVSGASKYIWGYNPEELTGRNSMDLVHPDDHGRTREMAGEIITGNVETGFENRYIRKDGTVIDLIWSVRWDDTDKLMYCVAKDATGLKEAEKKVHLNEKRFRNLVQEGVDMIAIVSEQSEYIYASPSYKTILGYDPDELAGLSALDQMIHPDDRESLLSEFKALEYRKKVKSSVYRARKKNGDYILMMSTATNMLNDPAIGGIIINSVDVTESTYYSSLEKLERDVLEKSMAGEKLTDILSGYIRGIESLHTGMKCSILKIESGKMYNLVSPSLPKAYTQAIDGIQPGPGAGSCGTSAFTGKKVIVTDTGIDEKWKDFRKIARRFQLHSCWSYPVITTDGEVVAAFAAYHDHPKKPGELEENTLERAARFILVVIENERILNSLRKSNKKLNDYKYAIDESSYVVMTDARGYIIDVNDSTCGKSGYSREELIGRHSRISKSGYHPDSFYRKMWDTITKGNVWRGEMNNRAKDGSTYWVDTTIVPFLDATGKPYQYLALRFDISKQKEEEQRLKLMESVVTNTRDAVLITKADPVEAPDGPEIVYVNKAFEKMSGYKKDEVIGKTPRFLQGPDTDQEALKELGEKIRHRKQAVAEIINYRKNGEEFWNNFTVSPLAGDKDGLSHYIAVERDVSQRKNREIRQTLFSKISGIFTETEGVREALKNTLVELAGFGNFQLSEIWLISHDRQSIELVAGIEKGKHHFHRTGNSINTFSVGEGLPGKTWKTGTTQFWKNIDRRKSFLRQDAVKSSGINTAYGFPIRYKDEVTGVLLLGMKGKPDKPHYYTPILEEIALDLGGEIHRKELEEELSRIFSSAPDIICVAGFDGYFRKVNPAMSELLGFSEKELLEKPLLDLVHPDDRKKTELELKNINRGNGKQIFENRFITKAGKIIWLLWSTRIFADEEVTYSVAKDVTIQKELEVLLDQSNRLAKIGSWEVDLTEETVYWSDITRELHEAEPGFTPDLEVALKFFKEGENRQSIEDAVNRAVENGLPWDMELQIVTAKGVERWVRSIGKAERMKGKTVRLFGSFQDIHQQKEAEVAYQKASEERADILESIGDCFFAVNRDWTVTYWNHMAEQVLDLPREKILGKNLWEIYIEAVDLEFYTQYLKAMNENIKVQFQEYYPGLNKWFEVSVYPSHTGLSIFFHDITDRKVTESRILQKTKQLDAIAMFNGQIIQRDDWLKALEDCLGVFGEVVDADRVYYFSNDFSDPKLGATTSMNIEWVRGKIKPEIDNPDLQNIPVAGVMTFMEILAKKKPYNMIVSQIPDKNLVKFLEDQDIKSILALPVFTGKTFRGFIGFDDCTRERVWSASEISFLKTIAINLASSIENEDAEIALQKAFDEKNEILESIGDGFFAVDKEFTVTYWNNKAEQLLHTPKERILGQHLWDIFNDAKELESYRQYNRALKKQVMVQFEDYYETIDSWFEVSAYPSPLGLSVFFKDISDRKKADEHLKELYKSLEVHTKELAASNAELEQFAFVASHDLQEPLRMITGFLAQIEKKYSPVLDEKGKKYIHFATDGAKRMRQIILDLLEFSRIGRVGLEREEIDLNELLREALSLNKKLISERNAIIKSENLPVITAAKGSMRQLFQNLLNNALKYQEKGSIPAVNVFWSEDNEYWKFSFQDNGIGIKREYGQKIFNIFQRLHTKDEYSGSGMGLAICKKIVEEHGGRIGVKSEENKGSTFYFTIAKKQKDVL